MMEPIRVVIADDESIRLMSLKGELEALGLQVVGEAADGKQAVALVLKLKPDLAVLDIRMPGMDGLEAAKRIAEEYPIPVIVLTAYSERSLAERAVEAGVSAYLMKPVSRGGSSAGRHTRQVPLRGIPALAKRYQRSQGGTGGPEDDRAGEGHPHGAEESERGRSIQADADAEPEREQEAIGDSARHNHGRSDAMRASTY